MTWYNNSWNRRRVITLTATPVANYQIKVILTNITLTGAQLTSGNANGNDIRFTGQDGSTLQNHWIESWSASGTIVTATIWTRVTTSGTSSIYMYYGNSGATTTSSSSAVSTGGTITEISNYRIHTFTGNGTLTSDSSRNVETLIVGGGGGGGGTISGGGGAGGLISYTAEQQPPGAQYITLTNQAYSVTVGNGGTGGNGHGGGCVTPNKGGDSTFASYTAIGGGGTSALYPNGGSGSGAGYCSAAGTGVPGQGYNGGSSSDGNNYGAGGGGAGGIGNNGGLGKYANGGVGIANSITGTSKYYAGGGGGGTRNIAGVGTGGSGIGGNGTQTSSRAGDGLVNTGSGGGGAGYNGDTPVQLGGNGGSGIVIIRYPIGYGTLGIEQTAPNITAYTMVLNPYICNGPCNVEVGVTWQNLGSVDEVLSDPAIYVNSGQGSPTRIPYPGGPITIPGNGTNSILMSISLSSAGTYTICPDPN